MNLKKSETKQEKEMCKDNNTTKNSEQILSEKKKEKKNKKRKLVKTDHETQVEEKIEKPKKRKTKLKEEGIESVRNGEIDQSDEIIGHKTGTENTTEKKKKKKKAKKEEIKEEPDEMNGSNIVTENGTENHTELSQEEKEGAFANFKLSEKTLDKLKARGVSYLFPIQAKTFDHIYEGHDVIAQARTGTGKTLSFALPIIEKLQLQPKDNIRGRPPKVIVMAPTRELANQVSKDFMSVTDQLKVLCIYGGTSYFPQESALREGIDVLVGTPGRIMDHIKKGHLVTLGLKHVILDEVDRMLDMGFADSVDEILQKSYDNDNPENNPQTLLFSATLPPWVHQTSKKYMTRSSVKVVKLVGANENRAAVTVQHLAIRCSYHDRAATLGSVLQVYSGNHGRAMVFCQTKRDADELAVSAFIKQETHVLHGDIPQDKREMVLQGFREGKYRCLITTDVAARGLDVPEVDLVIQCSPPQDVDSYIHRSGRTGRAGRQGTCICFYKPQEEQDLKWVEKKAGLTFKRVGAPTANDIIKASASDAARSLEGVSTETLSHFKEYSEQLIKEKGAVDALSAALAVISGNKEIVERSLLSSQEGYTTYKFSTNIEMNTTSYAWRALERFLPENVKESVKSMRFCKDKKGCVFDLPSQHNDVIDRCWQDGKWDTLERARELPELLESRQPATSGYARGFQGRRQGGYQGNRGSFHGNRGRASAGSYSGNRRTFQGNSRNIFSNNTGNRK